MGRAFRHIVLFRVHDDVPDARLPEAIDGLASFSLFPGVTDWTVKLSLDARKGRIIVEDGTFESREAFEMFRVDPDHVRAGVMMAEISDWWVGDYEL